MFNKIIAAVKENVISHNRLKIIQEQLWQPHPSPSSTTSLSVTIFSTSVTGGLKSLLAAGQDRPRHRSPPSVLMCGTGTLRHAIKVQEENIYYESTILFGYLKPIVSNQTRTSSLALSVSGAEILLTDDQGNQVGDDQGSNEFLFNIPN